MILILGMPGSGKTTQTQILGDYLECSWFSMGELIREHATGEDRELMLQGKIIADEPTLKILDIALDDYDLVKNECIVEGNPRSIPQAKWWLNKIKKGDVKFTALLHLVMSVEDAQARLASRHRVDDEDVAVLKKRFAEYHRSITPTLEFLKKQDLKVRTIDAAQSIEHVAADIKKALKI